MVNEDLLGASQAQSRGRVIRKVVDYPEYVSAEFNSSFVTMQYFGYLRRDPETAGFNFWLAKLNLFNGNFVDAEWLRHSSHRSSIGKGSGIKTGRVLNFQRMSGSDASHPFF
jgi:hypothetical protein